MDANETGGVSVEKHHSIPSMVDGLIPIQRDILSYAFKHDLVTGMGVYSLACFVLTDFPCKYDAPDIKSLTEAIIGMAQDFVGSNNISLFNQRGQFGSRLEGGKDYSCVYHICTNLTPIARLLYPSEDDIFFDYPDEDGQTIWRAPVIPLILVNGCQRNGTGWSTFAPNYKPKDLCANIRLLLENKKMVPMVPWYKYFQGTIVGDGESYTTSGKIEFIDSTKIRITELPVHTWTKDYKNVLFTLSTATGEIEEPFIKSYVWTNTPHFEITIMDPAMKEEELVKKLKLTSTISTSNMHLVDPKGVIKKYDNPEQIVSEFFDVRLELYEKRREMLLENHKLDLFKLKYQLRFIRVLETHGLVNCPLESYVPAKWSRKMIFLDLRKCGLLPLVRKLKKFDKENCPATQKFDKEKWPATDGLEVNEERFCNFYENIILSMNYLTFISKENVRIEKKNLIRQVKQLENSTAKDLWLADLAALEKKLEELEKNEKAKVESDNIRIQKMYEGDLLIQKMYEEDLLIQKMMEEVSPSVDGRKAPRKRKRNRKRAAKFGGKLTRCKLHLLY